MSHISCSPFVFFFNDTATTEIYTLSLHDALPISSVLRIVADRHWATDVIFADTLTLFQRLEQRSDERVDARAYLRARLIDVLVGDWDRHISQWRWARFDMHGERIWQPIPRDRDHAFSRFDGVFPSVAEYYSKQLAGLGSTYPSI